MRAWVGLLVACVMGLGAALPWRAGAAESVVVGFLPAADFLPAFIAKERGFFAAHGIDAEMKPIGNGATMPAALSGGSLQVGTPTMPGILLGAENGLDLVAIAGTVVSAPGYRFIELVARPDLPTPNAKAFEHTTVGLPGINGFAHFLLVKYLTVEGVDLSTMRFIELTFPQMGDALKSHQADAVLPVNPFLGRIVAAGAGRVVDGFGASVPDDTVAVVWASTRPYATAHPQVVAGFRAAIAEGIAWNAAHPQDADETLSHFLPLPREVLKMIPKPPYTATVTPAQVRFWIDLLAAQKLVSGSIDPNSVLVK